jgi:hypothetical protein
MKIERTETCVSTDDAFPRIGPIDVETPRGRCTAHDAPGLLCMEIRNEDGSIKNAAIMVYEPEPGLGVGLLCHLGANTARTLAASLLRIADLMEPPTLNS